MVSFILQCTHAAIGVYEPSQSCDFLILQRPAVLRYDHTDDVPPPSIPGEGSGDYEDADSITDADADANGDGEGNSNPKPAVPYSDVFFDDAADK